MTTDLKDTMKALEEIITKSNQQALLKGIEMTLATYKKQSEQTSVKNTINKPQVLTTKQVMDYLDISRTTVYKWEQKGYLPSPHYMLGKKYHYLKDIKATRSKMVTSNYDR